MTQNNRNLSLRGLRTFCVAADNESFRDAADRLFLTASAVSYQIRNLEDELGQKLFERSSRSLSLTDTGRSLLIDVKPILSNLDEVASRYRRSAGKQTLSISVQPFFASELFIPRLQDFATRYPDVDLKVDTSDESIERHPSGADVSIRVFKSPPDGLASDRLFPLRLLPVASPGIRDELVCAKDRLTGDVSLIVHDGRPKAWRQWQKSSGVQLPEDASVIRLDSMIAVARAAERGLGVALVPVQLSDSWFESGSLVPLYSHELTTPDAYYLVCRKDDENNEAVIKLRDWVLQIFGDTA